MTSAALVPALVALNGNVSANQKLAGADADTNLSALRSKINELITATAVTIRDDNALRDGAVPLRCAGQDLLDYIQANGGGGTVSSGGLGTSVKGTAYLAKGDGVTDDTAAIQLAINAVYAQGGGVVFFPTGTYLISIVQVTDTAFKHALTLYPNVVLRGESREASVLKLKNSAGNYMSILSRALSADRNMDDVGLYDLCIDQNNANNEPTDLSDISGAGNYRTAFLAYGGHRITIRNCWFKNYKSVNTVVCNAPISMCTDVQITGNWFDHAASATIANDHSAIYTSASEVVIAFNRFRSPAKNTYGATTAIELHGSQTACFGNIITNYLIGCNLTGVAYASDGLTFQNNIMEGGRDGVQLWSWFYGGNTTQPALSNVVISGNSIRLDRDAWPQSPNISFGIATDGTGTAPMKNIKISDNLIYWEHPTTITNVSDQYSCGINFERPSIEGVGYDSDIEITGNQIMWAPANGIRMVADIRRLTISGNTIYNCGQSVSGVFVTAFRAAIMAFPPTVCFQWNIHHNRMIDDQGTPTMTYGLSHGNAAAIDCRFEDNTWTVGGGHTYPVYSGAFVASAGWYIRQTVEAYAVAIIGYVKAGSSILITNTGDTRTQTATPQGSTYVSTVPTVFPAFQLSWGQASGLGALDSSADLTAQFSGSATLIIGGTLPANIWLRGAVSTTRSLLIFTGNSQRIGFSSITAETGADAGCDLAVRTYTDAGAFIDDSWIFGRAAAAYNYSFRDVNLGAGKVLRANGNAVVGARAFGWTAATNTKLKTTFDTTTVTTANLAARVGALIDDLITHGLIG